MRSLKVYSIQVIIMARNKCYSFTVLYAGMCYLHDNNVVHRDLKPANSNTLLLLALNLLPLYISHPIVLLSGESVAVARAKICDFDIARTLKGSITASGQAGTHGYMAPEVYSQKKVLDI